MVVFHFAKNRNGASAHLAAALPASAPGWNRHQTSVVRWTILEKCLRMPPPSAPGPRLVALTRNIIEVILLTKDDDVKYPVPPVIDFEFPDDEEVRQIIANLETKARAGDSQAQLKLGRHYAGLGLIEPDYPKALDWLQKAEAAGEKAADELLGDLYYEGNAMPVQYSKAFSCYQKCGDIKRAGSWYRLGEMYRLGLGTTKNLIQALACYDKIVHGPIGEGYSDFHQASIFRFNALTVDTYGPPRKREELFEVFEELQKARLSLLRNEEARELASIPKEEWIIL